MFLMVLRTLCHLLYIAGPCKYTFNVQITMIYILYNDISISRYVPKSDLEGGSSAYVLHTHYVTSF